MGANIRIALLIGLVIQNSLCALLGRASRTAAKPEDLYNINHFITVSECGKFILSLFLECYVQGGLSGLMESIHTHIFQNPRDAVKGSLIPAFLYLISNTLLYVALSNLSAPVFQVLCQFKLITTTIMSVVLLRRLYSRKQWYCIFFLCLGVATVINGEHRQRHHAERVSSLSEEKEEDPAKNILIGITTIGISCLLSSLAGVYFELIVKNSNAVEKEASVQLDSCDEEDESVLKITTSPSSSLARVRSVPSLWIRNMMLAFFSLIFGTMQGFMQKEPSKSFFHGFSVWVWVQVLLLSCGGLLVAGVIKYADNVVKGLATGISVVLSSSISILFLGDEPTQSFFVGVTLIVSSVYLFNNDIKLPTLRQTANAGLLYFVIFPYIFLQVGFPLQQESDKIVQDRMELNKNVTLHNMPNILHQEVNVLDTKTTHEANGSFVFVDTPSKTFSLDNSNDLPHEFLNIRFHVVTVGNFKDCGGCLVLNLLGPAIRDLGYNVTESGCPSIGADENVVIIYSESTTNRCPGNNKTAHVHWMLAPLNVLSGTKVLEYWKPEDMVFHYGTNSQGSTKIPVPLTNQLTLAQNPYPGDETDPDVIAKYKPLNRSGVSYILRKAKAFHGNIWVDRMLPHEHLGINATLLRRLKRDINTNRRIMSYEFFLSYDPYTYWSLQAAMLGTISVVHPVKGLSKEEWVSGFYVGGYLRSKNLTLNLPGIAYGWNRTEVSYARESLHQLRPLLLDANAWGRNVTVSRLIRDSKRWILGERKAFEGAVLAKDFYDKWD